MKNKRWLGGCLAGLAALFPPLLAAQQLGFQPPNPPSTAQGTVRTFNVPVSFASGNGAISYSADFVIPTAFTSVTVAPRDGSCTVGSPAAGRLRILDIDAGLNPLLTGTVCILTVTIANTAAPGNYNFTPCLLGNSLCANATAANAAGASIPLSLVQGPGFVVLSGSSNTAPTISNGTFVPSAANGGLAGEFIAIGRIDFSITAAAAGTGTGSVSCVDADALNPPRLGLTPATQTNLTIALMDPSVGCALTDVSQSGDVSCSIVDSAGTRTQLTTVTCPASVTMPAMGPPFVPLRDVTKVATGAGHTCVVTTAGGAKCWGDNSAGQLGDNSTISKPTAIDVMGLVSGVREIAAGNHHTCVLTTAGGVKCWGRNDGGQLGDNSTTNRLTATDVSGLTSGVAAISAGSAHTCAVGTGGGLKCWGDNSAGQLGDASILRRLVPTDVSGLATGVAMVSAGTQSGLAHTCAVMTSGAAKCWGSNGVGQLGDGTTISRLLPTDVNGLSSGVATISVANRHTCARMLTGGVKCWGDNSSGQLGDNSTTNRSVPTDVPGLSGVSEIATGAAFVLNGNFNGASSGFTCALLAAGGVSCWGENGLGQLGSLGGPRSVVPVPVTNLTTGVTAIATSRGGGGFACARLSNSELRCWGVNNTAQLGTGGPPVSQPIAGPVVGSASVQRIAAGTAHSCLVTSAGAASCWGLNLDGRVGDGGFGLRPTPVPVMGLGSGVTGISLGDRHSCAVVNGGARCWGRNTVGQLGDNTNTDRPIPVPVTGLGVNVAAVEVGGFHSCAINATGFVLCWGENSAGQLGDGSVTTRLIPQTVVGGINSVTAISAGGGGLFVGHTCARTNTGRVQCWGDNGAGQLGDGSIVPGRPTPADVTGLTSGVSAIAAGAGHNCALTTGGGVKCWGSNRDGQLGDNSTTDRRTPVDVSGLTSGVAAIAAGELHTCALLTSGALKCWGSNSRGQLGDGGNTRRLVPGDVARLTSVSAIALGAAHSCAALASGQAFCWGENFTSQLGNGAAGFVPMPVAARILMASRYVAGLVAATNSTAANNASQSAATDAAGRYVVYQSSATNLVTDDTNGAPDIFRVDQATGITTLVSVDNEEGQIVGTSISPSISANGRWVVFVSPDAAVSKVHGETKAQREKRMKGSDYSVYLRDMISGTTQQVSTGTDAGTGTGTEPEISADAESVVYTSENAAGQENVYYVNLTYNSSTDTITTDCETSGTCGCASCVAIGKNGEKTTTLADDSSGDADVSADGNLIVFETLADNLIAGSPSPCTGTSVDVMLFNALSGTMSRVSPPEGTTSCGTSGSTDPSIDYSGTTIAFETDQPLESGDANALADVYVATISGTTTSGTTTTISRASEESNGADGNGASSDPEISGDGDTIAFVSAATDLDTSTTDSNAKSDVHVKSLDDNETSRLSTTTDGSEANSASQGADLSYNGTTVVFDSDASNLTTDGSTQLSVYARSNPSTVDVVFRTGFD